MIILSSNELALATKPNLSLSLAFFYDIPLTSLSLMFVFSLEDGGFVLEVNELIEF